MTNQEKTREVAPRRDMFSLGDMRAEMDRLWEAMTSRSPFLTSFTRIQQPAVDVFEKDGSIHVRAEVPGIDQKDINVEVSDDGLVISGEKKEEKEVKEEHYYRSERSYGKFTRRVPLPRTADTKNATAKFKDGILEIDMPLTNGGGPRKIEIKE
jgi:HSP20 family protein